MKFFEFFVLFYLMVFIAGWTMWGLHVNDAYLYINVIITIALILAIAGTIMESKTKDLKQEEIKWSWKGKNVDWTETEENRTDADREI